MGCSICWYPIHSGVLGCKLDFSFSFWKTENRFVLSNREKICAGWLVPQSCIMSYHAFDILKKYFFLHVQNYLWLPVQVWCGYFFDWIIHFLIPIRMAVHFYNNLLHTEIKWLDVWPASIIHHGINCVNR